MIELIPVVALTLSSLSAGPAALATTADTGAAAPLILRAEPFPNLADLAQLREHKAAIGSLREAHLPASMTELHVERDGNGELVARCRVVGSPNMQGVLRPQLLQRELPR